MAHSKTFRASLQRTGFQVRSRSILPNPVSEVCGDFSNRVLSSFSGRYQGHGSSLCCFREGTSLFLVLPWTAQKTFLMPGTEMFWGKYYHTQIYIQSIHIYTQTWTHTYTCTCIHIHAFIHMYPYIHTYTHMHTLTGTIFWIRFLREHAWSITFKKATSLSVESRDMLVFYEDKTQMMFWSQDRI